jgi:hypothetical protein
MAKKKNEETEETEPVLQVEEDIPEAPSEKPQGSPKEKIKAKVYAIVKNNLLVKDGNGIVYQITITEKYEHTKIGDTVLL